MSEEFLIPPLREDLILTPAPRENGAPCWMVQDPVRGTFLRADWAQFTVLKFLDRPQDFSALCARLRAETTLRLPAEEVRGFIADLSRHNLLRPQLVRPAEALVRERQRTRQSFWRWLLSHYLYFRLPLLHPDAFLTRTAGYFRALISRPALAVYGIMLLAGLYFLCQRFSFYADLARAFLNWQGAFAFGAAVVAVKALHEFSHAYAAKLLGNHVPAMGVAFIVFWPVPYCDVSDSWRMASRRHRLLISSAGIICELVIAAASLSLCVLCAHPVGRGVFFMLATAGLAGTLLVNLNPLMRFDGYYLFCDLLGVDNLYGRSSGLLRHVCRRELLGMELPDPEPAAAPAARRLLITYAACAWVYRFFLYFGIALVVYYAFPKIIGICLFALEISLFLLAPAAREIRFVVRNRGKIRARSAGLALAGGAAALLLWAGLPLPRHTGVPAVYEPARTQIVYAPFAGTLREVRAQDGARVTAGETLAVVAPPAGDAVLAGARAETAALRAAWRRELAAAADSSAPGTAKGLREQLSGALAREQGVREQAQSGIVRAETAGTVSGWDSAARPGAVVAGRARLGAIIGDGAGRAQGYLAAELAPFVPDGARAVFVSSASGKGTAMALGGFSPVRERELRDTGMRLAEGGKIPAIPGADGKLLIDGSYFLLTARAETPAPGQPGGGQTGTLWFWSSGRSYLAAAGRALWRVLLRESGL